MFDKTGAEVRSVGVLDERDLLICSQGEAFRPLKKKKALQQQNNAGGDSTVVATRQCKFR